MTGPGRHVEALITEIRSAGEVVGDELEQAAHGFVPLEMRLAVVEGQGYPDIIFPACLEAAFQRIPQSNQGKSLRQILYLADEPLPRYHGI